MNLPIKPTPTLLNFNCNSDGILALLNSKLMHSAVSDKQPQHTTHFKKVDFKIKNKMLLISRLVNSWQLVACIQS